MTSITSIGTRNIIVQQYLERQEAIQRTFAAIKECRKQGLNPEEEYPRIAREVGLDTMKLYDRERDRIEKALKGEIV